MKSHDKKGISRLLEISGEKKWALSLSAVFAGLSTIAQIFPYIGAYKIIYLYIIASEKNLTVNTDDVYFWGIIALVSVLVSMILNGTSFVLSHFAAFRIIFNLRLNLARHLAKLPLGYFTNKSTGEIHKTIHDNVDLIELFISHKIPDLIMTFAGALVVFGLYLYVDLVLGLICIGVYALSLYIQFRIYGDSGVKEEIKGYFKALENINSASMEFTRGIPVFKMFNLSAKSFTSLKNSVVTYRDFALRFAKRGSRDFIIFTILVNFFFFFIYPIVIWVNSSDPLDSGIVITALFFTVLSNAILPSLMNIMNISNVLMTISEGVERIDAIFKVDPLKVPEVSQKPQDSSLEFQNVSFTYPDFAKQRGEEDHAEEEKTLNNVSFKVEAGKSLAIIGPSGSGKSSILSLIARFYDVDSGAIKIGGVDIRDMSEADLMDTVSIVLQKTFMFRGTIRDNIVAGKAYTSDAEVLKAAHLAQCDDIIEKYGLDYFIEGGSDILSGGEKQRINIARAIYKNAPILLLDEVSSALDPENERLLNLALEALKKDKTIIMVAHKLDAVVNADHIVMVEKGAIVTEGRYQDLLKTSDKYQKLWNLYVSADKWQFRVGGKAHA